MLLLVSCATTSSKQTNYENLVHKDTDDVVLPKLPDYYFNNNYLQDKISLINEKVKEYGDNGDVFFWITDIHWEADRNARYSPSLIDYIRQRTSIMRLFNGGDNQDGIDGFAGGDISEYNGNVDLTNKLRKALNSDKVYTIYGNHEVIHYNNYSELFYAIRQHNNDVVYGDADKSYFYVDNKEQKIRYIALTAFGVPEEGKHFYELAYRNEFEYNTKQLDWLRSNAMNLSSDWTVIIFIHGLFAVFSGQGNTYAPKLSVLNSRKVAWGEPWPFENVWIDAINNYSTNKKGVVIDHDPRPLDGQGNIDVSLAETVGSVPALADKFMLYSPSNNNIYNRYVARIEWYSAGQVWKLVWTEYGTYESATTLNVGDEVTIWKGFPGKIAGVFQGHSHKDRMHIENGIPYIISACDRFLDVGDLTITRTPGTVTEQHFEIAVLDKVMQKWTLISIGAPANDGFDDKVGNEVQVREVHYR